MAAAFKATKNKARWSDAWVIVSANHAIRMGLAAEKRFFEAHGITPKAFITLHRAGFIER
jgi:hypothetical protein